MQISGLTKTTAWYSAGNLFVRSASFLLLPLYSNFISPAEFGNYALLMSFYSFAMVLYQGGYQTALTKFYLKEENPVKRNLVFNTISESAIIAAFLLSVIVILSSLNISRLIFQSDNYAYLIVLISAAMFLETTGSQFINLLVTRESAAKVVIISAVGALVNFALNFLFVYYIRLGVEGIILAQVITAAAVILILSPTIIKEIIFQVDLKILKKVLWFVLPLIAGGILSIGVDVADRFILNYFRGTADVGIYSFSYRIALVMNLFVVSFRTAWTPHSIKLYFAGNYSEQFGGTLLKFLAASGTIYIVVSLLTGDLFNLSINGINFFDNRYAGGVQILPFILGGYLLSGISSIYSVYPFVSDKTYHFVISDGLSFVVNILINLILIPVYGMIGAAIATLISFTIGSGYLMMISRRHVNIAYPFKQITIVLLLIIIFAGAGSILNNPILDIILIGGYLSILLVLLKMKPFEMLFGKGVNKTD